MQDLRSTFEQAKSFEQAISFKQNIFLPLYRVVKHALSYFKPTFFLTKNVGNSCPETGFFWGRQKSGNKCLICFGWNRCRETGIWIWFQETGVRKQVSWFLLESGVRKQVSCFLLETGVRKHVSRFLLETGVGKQVSGFNCHWALNVRKQMSKYPTSHVFTERKCLDTGVGITLVWVTGDPHPSFMNGPSFFFI